jgi:putative FmdB family regulatory protein
VARPYTLPAMPTYEYRCRDCGHSFDVVQKMTDDPLTECPNCGGHLRKVFAPPAIAFKGSGFYATDHGKRAKKPDGAKDGGEGAKDGAKSDSKPDGKKESSSEGTTKTETKGDTKGGSKTTSTTKGSTS